MPTRSARGFLAEEPVCCFNSSACCVRTVAAAASLHQRVQAEPLCTVSFSSSTGVHTRKSR